MKTKVKKKMHKTSDPHYEVHTYGQGKNPFDVEWLKYYNPVEGRDQIIFLYIGKDDKKIYKHKILR
tara:strand:+ start:1160 stop:1357 length:198 start_codon:yes stop_codon:yes gene_type:complete